MRPYVSATNDAFNKRRERLSCLLASLASIFMTKPPGSRHPTAPPPVTQFVATSGPPLMQGRDRTVHTEVKEHKHKDRKNGTGQSANLQLGILLLYKQGSKGKRKTPHSTHASAVSSPILLPIFVFALFHLNIYNKYQLAQLSTLLFAGKRTGRRDVPGTIPLPCPAFAFYLRRPVGILLRRDGQEAHGGAGCEQPAAP